jgi:hypothetical protein
LREVRGSRLLVALTLFVVAALYFARGITSTLEFMDEGCIIYPIWRVAHGAIPYRDFRQLYGPSLFFLNAGLLRIFGPDLLVIRIALVVLKATVAVLVYLLSCRIARWPFALMAYALCVALWGVPWWVMNSPYASHWAIALNLAALVIFLSLANRLRTASLLAGLCFGLATTFKQTTGVFGFASLLLFLTYGVRSTPAQRSRSIVGLMVLLGATGLFVAYLARHLTSWSSLMILAPIAATLGVLVAQEIRAGTWLKLAPQDLSAIVFSSIGMALPLLAYGVFYLAHGSVAALADNLALGLPQTISRFVPLPEWGVRRAEWWTLHDAAGPELRTVLSGLVVLAASAALWLWRNSRAVDQRSRFAYRAAVAVCLLAAAALAADLSATGGVVRYFATGEWGVEVYRLYFWIPLLLVWICLGSLYWTRSVRSDGSAARPAGRRETALRLVHLHATVGLLQLYPTADIWHVLMMFPIFLPLLAYQLDSLQGMPEERAPRLARYAAAGLSIAVVVWLALPFVEALRAARAARPAQVATFSRATDIWDAGPKFREAAPLVDYLRTAVSPEQPVLVIPGDPLIYFLAGRVSALDAEEYTLYLIGAGLISERNAQHLIDQEKVIARLEASRPPIVEYDDSAANARFLQILPQLAQYIRGHYRVAHTFGNYRVLDWAVDQPAAPTTPRQ